MASSCYVFRQLKMSAMNGLKKKKNRYLVGNLTYIQSLKLASRHMGGYSQAQSSMDQQNLQSC